MAFERQQPITPVRIGNIEVVLFSPDPESETQPFVRGYAEVILSDGSKVQRPTDRDLAPHLTQQQISDLRSFIDSLRVQAETEILP